MGKPVEPDSYLLDRYPGHIPLPFLQIFLSPHGTKAIQKAHGIIEAINKNAKVKPMLHRRLLALSVACRVPWFKSDRRRMQWLRREVYNDEHRLLEFLGALPIKAFFDLREADAHIYDTAAENEEHLCLHFSEQLHVGLFTSLTVFESFSYYHDIAEAIVEGFGIPTSDPRGSELQSSVARGLNVAGRIATHVVNVQLSLPSIYNVHTDNLKRPYLKGNVAKKIIAALSNQIVNLNDTDETDLRAALHCLTEGTKPLLRVHYPDEQQKWLRADMWRLWVLTQGLQPLIDVFEAECPLDTGLLEHLDDHWVMLMYNRWPHEDPFCSDFQEWWMRREVKGLPDELQSSGGSQFSNKYDVDALNIINHRSAVSFVSKIFATQPPTVAISGLRLRTTATTY
ncbi:uncharacterized protein EKO05_0006103 [Ascochyta rabiei]|uniref:uncharacterized protein n=1 Tax=Didymella rabiei TaxID=5454 RepID=UPI002206C370|nr:uncharacterized protein EKO05_0006103 [Ascochyta rabiei]UPX15662.1 hypothetical protein EKO05_0006103 [Ascochyta rabiei]